MENERKERGQQHRERRGWREKDGKEEREREIERVPFL